MFSAVEVDRSAAGFDTLVVDHVPLVSREVHDLAMRLPRHVDRDELTSAGLLALVRAARQYDPARGVAFAQFAAPRVRGALLDELRGLDWASRSVRNRARLVAAARDELVQTLGRTPSGLELAEALGMTAAELDALAANLDRASVLSLDGIAYDGPSGEDGGPESALLYRERLDCLHAAIDALPVRLREVVVEYDLRGRPMADIAAALGVSESRVSQLRTEALSLLRDGLETQLDPDRVPRRPVHGRRATRRAEYRDQVRRVGRRRGRYTTDRMRPMLQLVPA